jgi:hypothetical protein
MRRFIIILLLIAAVFFFVTQRFQFISGTSKEGVYKIVMVDKKTGSLTNLWGK